MRENNSDSRLGSENSSNYCGKSLLSDWEEPTSDSEGDLSDMLGKGDVINVLKLLLKLQRSDHIFL